ncbi:ribonuclease domain-containing protein [Enterococcus termitis]|uniref:ribonuclease domain-containing protein n=1 Tax=Enterococcus termitis TaxID=332950 RepID=UPI001360256D|nr:hypothetical protein [Listeria monocytogenes]
MKLPEKSSSGAKIEYKEFDVSYDLAAGNRGTERFVHGSDGSVYYTNDRYKTFVKVK